MKTKISLVLLLPLALSFAVSAGEFSGKVIKLGVDPTYPPLEFKTPQGALTGFGVDCAIKCRPNAFGLRAVGTE